MILTDSHFSQQELARYLRVPSERFLVIPLGGDHVTNDIAVGLRTPIAEAERIKIKYGHAISSKVPQDEHIEVPSIGGDTVNNIPRRHLCEIIEDRMVEFMKIAYTEVRNTGLAEDMHAGLVIRQSIFPVKSYVSLRRFYESVTSIEGDQIVLMKRAEKDVQDVTNSYITRIDDVLVHKEKEVMEV